MAGTQSSCSFTTAHQSALSGCHSSTPNHTTTTRVFHALLKEQRHQDTENSSTHVQKINVHGDALTEIVFLIILSHSRSDNYSHEHPRHQIAQLDQIPLVLWIHDQHCPQLSSVDITLSYTQHVAASITGLLKFQHSIRIDTIQPGQTLTLSSKHRNADITISVRGINGRKFGVAPSVAHFFPDSTKPTVNSCITPPHFPPPVRDDQLETVHTSLRRF